MREKGGLNTNIRSCNPSKRAISSFHISLNISSKITVNYINGICYSYTFNIIVCLNQTGELLMDNEEKVLNAVKKLGRSNIKDISEASGLSRSTVSKYLYGLEKSRKVKKEEMKPYTFWSLGGT